MWRRASRYFSPTGFVLAALCFLLPFATVSCDAPGGYGRSAPGGTTTYTGMDLVTGGAPTVDPNHLRAAEQRQDDQLDPQVLGIAALLLTLSGAGVAAVRQARTRRVLAAGLAAAAALFLVANQATATGLLAARVQSQLTVPMPAGKTAASYVHTAGGFLIALVLLAVLALGNLIARLRVRRGPVEEVPTDPTLGMPSDPWTGAWPSQPDQSR
jgi:hypothetical protein